MDHPSEASSSFQAGIEKLIQVGHTAAALSCQIQEVTALLTGTIQGSTDPAAVVDGLSDTVSNLNAAELMEIINLENTRQALMRSWRYVEARKGAIIQQGRERVGHGGATNGKE